MKLEKKGILAPYTIITSIITGSFFPLLGTLIALDLKVIETAYIKGIVLVMLGGFIAHWVLAHTIHDLHHIDVEDRVTLPKKTLKALLIISSFILLSITIYLAIHRGWPVIVFAIIGALVCLYSKDLFHHELQMALGAMFLVIGGFYVQVGTLNLNYIIWLKIICLAVFAFLSQYGWLLFYRLDDYGWNKRIKNKSILITKSGLFFLILYFIL
jgi:hypothetical protein